MIRRLVIWTALAAIALSSSPAAAHHDSAVTRCGDRDQVLEILYERYAERPRFWMTGQGLLFEITVSMRLTWTLLATDESGRTCIVLAGDDFRHAPGLPFGDPIRSQP